MSCASRMSHVALAGMLACLLMAGRAVPSALSVQVTGIPTDTGLLACSLHDDTAGFPDRAPLAVTHAVPQAGRADCVFDRLEPGRYAVAVLHDANGNGRLDMTMLGLPAEAWGVSGTRSRLRVPRFDDAAFQFGPGSGPLTIRLAR